MPLLRTQNTKVAYQRTRVDVPEFGADENGEPYYVFVRNLSIAERKEVIRRSTWVDQRKRRILFDYSQVAFLAAVDGAETGRGVRVFPSEQFLADLTPDFEPAIQRIALQALALSDLISPQGPPQGTLSNGPLEATAPPDPEKIKNA